jgi:hypothetical protein
MVSLLLALCAIARAQPSIDQFPSGLIQLPDGWRYHAGDNPAWANPSLDDSDWQVHDPLQPIDSCRHGCWYRLHIQLLPRTSPLALLLVAQQGVFDAYLDGKRSGDMHFEPWWLAREPVEFSLPIPNGDSSMLLAIHIRPPRIAFDANEAANLRAAIGSPASVQDAAEAHRRLRLIRFLPSGAINLAILLAGVAFLLLFASQQGSREYFWLGIYLALLGSSQGIFTAAVYAILPGATNELYADPVFYLGVLAQTEFTFAFIGWRPNRIWRAYEAFLVLCPIASILCSTGIIPNDIYFSLESLAMLPAALAIPLLLFYRYRHGNQEARWLILPSLAPAIGTILNNLPQAADLLGRDLSFLSRPILLWKDVPLFQADLAGAVFLLAIGIVMFFRFTSLNREQARASAELSAAREIQQQLVPSSLPSLPGCLLEAAYFPAAEVGGDFYQVLLRHDGTSLIILGDVSGKGLRAAMTGALAIGSIRTLASECLSPSALLTRLNQALCAAQNDGFITCLCGSIASGGRIAFANAGHLSPYLNGEELAIASGLPLGIVPDFEYSEALIEVAPGDVVSLVTDGVVEAQSSSGELFGFDRTSAISTQSALQIAAAAQSFGQSDDITVLTIRFTASST